MTNEWNISTSCYKTLYYLVWCFIRFLNIISLYKSFKIRIDYHIYRSFIEETSSLSGDRSCDCFGEKSISFAQVFYLPCTHECRRPRTTPGIVVRFFRPRFWQIFTGRWRRSSLNSTSNRRLGIPKITLTIFRLSLE